MIEGENSTGAVGVEAGLPVREAFAPRSPRHPDMSLALSRGSHGNHVASNSTYAGAMPAMLTAACRVYVAPPLARRYDNRRLSAVFSPRACCVDVDVAHVPVYLAFMLRQFSVPPTATCSRR